MKFFIFMVLFVAFGCSMEVEECFSEDCYVIKGPYTRCVNLVESTCQDSVYVRFRSMKPASYDIVVDSSECIRDTRVYEPGPQMGVSILYSITYDYSLEGLFEDWVVFLEDHGEACYEIYRVDYILGDSEC